MAIICQQWSSFLRCRSVQLGSPGGQFADAFIIDELAERLPGALMILAEKSKKNQIHIP